jgi:hypothetical protein
VTVRAPVLSTMLYESIHEAQFWMIFDANKQLLHSGMQPSVEIKYLQ